MVSKVLESSKTKSLFNSEGDNRRLCNADLSGQMDIGQDIRHNRKTGFLSNRPAKSDRKTHEQYSRYLGRQQTCLLSDEDRIL